MYRLSKNEKPNFKFVGIDHFIFVISMMSNNHLICGLVQYREKRSEVFNSNMPIFNYQITK